MGIKVFLAIILIAITAGGIAAAVKAKKPTLRTAAMVVTVIFALALVLIPSSLFVVSTGEIGVVKVFGEAKDTVHPGMNFRLWVTSEVDVYDVKTRQIRLSFQAYSKDAQTVTGNLAVQYQLKPESVLDINRQYGTVDVLEEKLKAVVIERAKSVFSDKGAMVIVENRSALSGEIEDRIKPMMEQYHVTVTAVALEDISFNDAFESAVEQKMVAEQAKLQAEYDKEKAIVKADEQVAVAQREAQAVVEKANGDAEALRIMQQAWSTLSAEVKDAMLRQTFYEKWNGILPEVMAGENMDLIIGGTSGYQSSQNHNQTQP